MHSLSPLGLYIHIPFCNKICHYCDFAKTANFSGDHIHKYMEIVERHLDEWMDSSIIDRKFTSVFFGGGTPGILTHQYTSLMAKILKYSIADVEITIEANPSNITPDHAQQWRDLGFTRLSMGVQTFDSEGLRALTRDHSRDQALQALAIAGKCFPRSNGDLIYGWPGQSENSWDEDLKLLAHSGVNHMSLYALTFEGQTPFARANRRGVMAATDDDFLASRYERACDLLANFKFHHEEISNWSMGATTCEHNWLYWRGQEYLGLGAGAHGFIDDGSDIGMRYGYAGDLRGFLRSNETPSRAQDVLNKGALSRKVTIENLLKQTGAVMEQDRDRWSWVQEYVGCALRTCEGVDLELITKKNFIFKPNALLEKGLAKGLLNIKGNRLMATEQEWFRETAWSLQICESLVEKT